MPTVRLTRWEQLSTLVSEMIARVTLEIALRKEFDYAIPAKLTGKIEVGSRVQVPFGPPPGRGWCPAGVAAG